MFLPLKWSLNQREKGEAKGAILNFGEIYCLTPLPPSTEWGGGEPTTTSEGKGFPNLCSQIFSSTSKHREHACYLLIDWDRS